MKTKRNSLWGWTVHGVSTQGKWSSNEQEYSTECLFCTSSDGLYINPFKGMGVYQCKVCSQQGNYLTFLREVHKLNQTNIKDFHIKALSEDRKLPIDAFHGCEIGWNGERFTIPVYNVENHFIGLQLYKPGEKIMNSPNTTTSLWNAPKLKKHLHGPVIICEGLWDGLAMRWLLKELEIKGLVVAVPGCNTNLSQWEINFYDQDIIILYDNDAPGIEGEFRAYQALIQKAKTLSFIHWPETKRDGYDVRDLIVKWGIEEANPKKAYQLIKKWLHEIPRRLGNMAVKDAQGKKTLVPTQPVEPISFSELIQIYQELLYMPNIDPIKVLLATVYANRFRSDMVWMFLVAPPSSGKSELILSLDGTPEIEHISTVTEHTFVSGFIGPGSTDVSLFDKLRNRIMAIKDFTPILQTVPIKQQQIFGTLRDAYDGKIDAMYGHASNRRYKDLHFGIIAGVTNEIERFGQMQQALGERFLRYYFLIDPDNESKILKKAEGNIMNEKIKREKLKHAVYRFLTTNKNNNMPAMDEKIQLRIRDLARFTAAMRGIVPRDWKERVQYHPSSEGPSRVNKQLNLMARGLACLEKKPKVDLEDLRIIRDIALSTCPDLVKTVVYALHHTHDKPLSQKNIEELTGFPVQTIKFVMDDLTMLKLVNKNGSNYKMLYTLNARSKELISKSGVYDKF